MPVAKISITPEQVQSDLKNVVTFLRAVDSVMPNQVDETLIDALTLISGNTALLTLLCYALSKV